MKAQRILAPLLSGLTHFAYVLGVFHVAPIIGLELYLAAALLVGAIVGLAFGVTVDDDQVPPVLLAACVGAFLAYLGPILTSYGLALAQAPIFLGNLLVLWGGMLIAKKCFPQ